MIPVNAAQRASTLEVIVKRDSQKVEPPQFYSSDEKDFAAEYKVPKTAHKKYNIGYATLFVDSNEWLPTNVLGSEQASFVLIHTDSIAMITATSSKQFVTSQHYLLEFLTSLRVLSQATNVTVTSKESTFVNGVQMMQFEIDATILGTPVVYTVLFHSNSKGMVAIALTMHRQMPLEQKWSMINALGGLVVKR